MEINNPNSSKMDRKFIERNRRNQMKVLYSKLNSLVPHHTSREAISVPDQVDEAANYIKGLQANLESMKEMKESLITGPSAERASGRPKYPKINIQEMGSSLVIALNTGLTNSQFVFNEAIRILHEERADVVNASFSVVDDTVFHTIHLTIGEQSTERAARVSERLMKFVQDARME